MRSILSLLLAAVLAAPSLQAQEARSLERGQRISDALTSNAAHRYTVELGEEFFVFGRAHQTTVDVVVRILGPDGDEIRRFDGPARGPENFQFESTTRGAYIVEVSPFEENEGDYAIELLKVEEVADDPEDRVDQLMTGYAGDDTPGVAVGVVDGGELRFARAYGMANLEHGVPFRTETISNIGSVTKQFTAMGLLLLQAEGKLSLDDDIRTHIPELPDFGVPITLKQLLNHTGGYREIYNLLPMTGRQGEDDVRREEAIRIVQRQPELQSQPGTEFNYNNTGYILVATVIERVSGMSFPEYMKANVFDPLGMTNTRVKAFQGEVIPGAAEGYVPAETGGWRTARDLAASYGAGGIYTTLADLTRWMNNYRDAGLGGPGAIEAITTSAVLADGDTTNYGLGLSLGELRGQRRWSHTGGDIAHRAYFGYFPDLSSGVILLSNNASFSLSVGRPIAELFFEDELEKEEEEEATAAEEDAEVSPERLEAVAGDWVLEGPGLPVEISIEDGELFIEPQGQPRLRAVATSDSTFAIQGVDASVTFHVGPDGTIDTATLHQNGETPLRRTEGAEPSPEDLARFEGVYFSQELETFYEIRLEDGNLTAHHNRLEPLTLEHREGDEFTAPGSFFGTLSFQRAGNGRITGFMAANGRTRDVWFQKRW